MVVAEGVKVLVLKKHHARLAAKSRALVLEDVCYHGVVRDMLGIRVSHRGLIILPLEKKSVSMIFLIRLPGWVDARPPPTKSPGTGLTGWKLNWLRGGAGGGGARGAAAAGGGGGPGAGGGGGPPPAGGGARAGEG